MITKVPEGDDFLKPCNHQLDRDTETPKVKANLNHLRMDIAFEKEFMKSFSSNVVPPNDIGVNFDDIGALQNVKDELKELVCKGILLYGPPGTGKTILAKAVAMEAGAYFINFSMSSIPPKWFGEADKYVKAVFSLASKKAPCVIFVDEVDRLLGQRRENLKGQQATQATLEIKNAFMKHWGLLLKKEKDCVLVLAVTNRPFDLEETVIGQFSHR
ncbi:AAA-type ATPase family protein [Raphanus sativus]|nr:AAA-type ATPase family protein [Raphanus sativus]